MAERERLLEIEYIRDWNAARCAQPPWPGLPIARALEVEAATRTPTLEVERDVARDEGGLIDYTYYAASPAPADGHWNVVWSTTVRLDAQLSIQDALAAIGCSDPCAADACHVERSNVRDDWGRELDVTRPPPDEVEAVYAWTSEAAACMPLNERRTPTTPRVRPYWLGVGGVWRGDVTLERYIVTNADRANAYAWVVGPWRARVQNNNRCPPVPGPVKCAVIEGWRPFYSGDAELIDTAVSEWRAGQQEAWPPLTVKGGLVRKGTIYLWVAAAFGAVDVPMRRAQ